jgi:hypothetical protein
MYEKLNEDKQQACRLTMFGGLTFRGSQCPTALMTMKGIGTERACCSWSPNVVQTTVASNLWNEGTSSSAHAWADSLGVIEIS